MAGFFNFMQRMVQGKPIFEDEEAAKNKDKAPTDSPEAPVDPLAPVAPVSAIRKHDDSSFPVVYIKRTTTRIQGSNMQVYCHIKNTWPEEIMLDKIVLLGTTHELDDYLSGGDENEFLVYSGPRPQKQYYEAQLHYKTRQEGDYFEAIHDMTSTYHSEDKTYTISDIRLRRPIRDIYE